MAKAVTIKVKLVSSADTGFYYVANQTSRTMTDKLVKKKYDPVARKHVEFREFQDQVGWESQPGWDGPRISLRFIRATPAVLLTPQPRPRDCGRHAWRGRARCRRA